MTRRSFLSGCVAFVAAATAGISSVNIEPPETAKLVLTKEELLGPYQDMIRFARERIAEDIERAFLYGLNPPHIEPIKTEK